MTHAFPSTLWRRGFSTGGLLAAAWLLASCAANKTANHLAGTTISELTAYEKSLEDKINAEEGFYRAQAARLTELQGYSVLPKAAAGAGAVPGKRSLTLVSAEDLMTYQMLVARLELNAQKQDEVVLSAKIAEDETKAKQELRVAEGKAAEALAQRSALAPAATPAEKGAADNLLSDRRAVLAEKRRTADGLARARAVLKEVTPQQLDEAKQFIEKHKAELAKVETREDAEKLLAEIQPAASKLASDEDETVKRVRNSLPYLRVAMASEREAILAVDKVLAQGTPMARTALTSFMMDGVVNDGANLEKAVLARQQLDAEVLKNLAKLESGKSKLGTVREELTKVREKKKFFARIKDLLEFGKETRKLYEESQKSKP